MLSTIGMKNSLQMLFCTEADKAGSNSLWDYSPISCNRGENQCQGLACWLMLNSLQLLNGSSSLTVLASQRSHP